MGLQGYGIAGTAGTGEWVDIECLVVIGSRSLREGAGGGGGVTGHGGDAACSLDGVVRCNWGRCDSRSYGREAVCGVG